MVEGTPAHIVHELCDDMDVPGLGGYSDFTHIDTRSSALARWAG